MPGKSSTLKDAVLTAGLALATLAYLTVPAASQPGSLAQRTPALCPALPSGHSEVARHGLPIERYQCYFDQMAGGGYEPEWLDMYDSGGRTYVNVIGQPASGAFLAYHGLTGAQYQARFDSAITDGYRLATVESYLQNGSPRYAAVFTKARGPAFVAYHGFSAAAHQARFEQLTQGGFQPRKISVVSVNGQLQFTGLYVRAGGSFVLRSQIPVAQYQAVYDQNRQAGRLPISLNGYTHNGQAMIAAVFSSSAHGGLDRHGLTGAQYQIAWNQNTGAGRQTRLVTGYHDGGARYAAAWRN